MVSESGSAFNHNLRFSNSIKQKSLLAYKPFPRFAPTSRVFFFTEVPPIPPKLCSGGAFSCQRCVIHVRSSRNGMTIDRAIQFPPSPRLPPLMLFEQLAKHKHHAALAPPLRCLFLSPVFTRRITNDRPPQVACLFIFVPGHTQTRPRKLLQFHSRL